VLLIEAGGRNEDAANLSGPERYEAAFKEGTPLNWRYRTQPQWKDQVIDYSRGRGLGGSTAINFCAWIVGPDDDFNEWAKMVGDDAFAWPNVKKSLNRIENFHNDVPEDFSGQIRPRSEDHGSGGPVDLSYQTEWLSTTRDVFNAASEAGLGINGDINNGNPLGMGLGPVCIYKGIRVTSASAYLANPPANLQIVTDALVDKIILENKAAKGVQTADGRYFKARNEVVICGGTLNSPQILLLSGIGPVDELNKHGIKIQHELPQVGRNLMDHCFSMAGLVVPGTSSRLRRRWGGSKRQLSTSPRSFGTCRTRQGNTCRGPMCRLGKWRRTPLGWRTT
jgi:choline dehydrogenase-like flavoprotein